MAKKIIVHLHGRAADQDYKRDEGGRFAEGDRVKASANYGGKTGHIESTAPSGAFHVVKHDDGSKSSYHESDLRHHEDDDEDSTHDAGFDESKVKRDGGGKFSTNTGKAGRGHHEEMVKRHAAAAEDPSSGASTALRQHHERAGYHHQEAINVLNKMDAGPDHARRSHVDEYKKHVTAGWQHEAAIAARYKGAASARETREVGKAMAKMDAGPDKPVSVPTAGSGKEKTFAIPKPPAGTPGGPVKGRGPVDLGDPKKAAPVSAVRGWRATSEPSQFGGHRPVVARMNGDPVHISGDAFDTPEQAHAYAEHLALHPGVVERGARPPRQASDFPGYRKQQDFKAGGDRPQPQPAARFTPMRQALRKVQAEQLRADRKVVKTPENPNRLKSVVREGAEANIADKMAEIRARLSKR